MVYCTKCGAKNEEDAAVCVKCGAPLHKVPTPPWRRERKRAEEECFGLPHGGAIAGLVIGLIIIFVGFSWLISRVAGIEIEVWPIIVIIFGILILAGALYGLRSRH